MTVTQRPSRSSTSSQSQPTATISSSSRATNTPITTNDNKKPTLHEQLDQAEAAIRKTRDATAQLHYWWRQHLFRLSCMVFLLCFYQARKPSEACIRNIKVRFVITVGRAVNHAMDVSFPSIATGIFLYTMLHCPTLSLDLFSSSSIPL